MRRVAILGSTGSIGKQALNVIAAHPDFFSVEVLCAKQNSELLIQQAKAFSPNAVVIADENKYEEVRAALNRFDIKIYAGSEALCQVMKMDSIDIVLTAMVGYAGLRPTLAAIEAGHTIALANKETLVIAGDLVTRLAQQQGVNIYPVDSEHSAIFQCLVGEWHNPIEKIILTASGGPFRGKDSGGLKQVTVAETLAHPNWNMGRKVTVDSASLMNKGLEAIEAKWLFRLKPEQIEVIIHPQSIIHSMVQFEDGSMKAQMSVPDMQLPIQFALSFPARLKSSWKRLDFTLHSELTFEAPDLETFRNLALAFEALRRGGNMPCILNAANEVAVESFLHEKISFVQMPELIENCMSKASFIQEPAYDDYVASDSESRMLADKFLKEKYFPFTHYT
jgi:1-deoxy-D-xylulose-5-phosphate reductoisomerase